MKTFYYLLLVLIISSCIVNKTEKELNEIKITKCDSIWLNFVKKMETRDIDFLLSNSIDTIQCTDCKINKVIEDGYYNARLIFKNHIGELMHLDTLSNKHFSCFQDDSLMHVIYDIKNSNAPEGSYNLIFNFVKLDDRLRFKGMVMTP